MNCRTLLVILFFLRSITAFSLNKKDRRDNSENSKLPSAESVVSVSKVFNDTYISYIILRSTLLVSNIGPVFSRRSSADCDYPK